MSIETPESTHEKVRALQEENECLKKALDQAIYCAGIELPTAPQKRNHRTDERHVIFIGSPYPCPELAAYLRELIP